MSRSTATRILFAVLAIAFFATPIAARVLGVTAEPFENRRLAEAPKLSQGWEAFQQTSAFLTDHMPLRAQAVRANTRIWTDLFGTQPRYARERELADDQALPFAGAIEGDDDGAEVPDGEPLRGPATASTGRDGWLYVPQEFEYACSRKPPDELLLERWAGLVRTIRGTGRETALLVAPHKASVYPEHLPAEYPFDHCALERKDRLWRRLAADGPAHGVVELRSQLLRLKADAGDQLFQRKDMHWTTLGALVLVKAALEAVGDGVELRQSEVVGRGAVPYVGDLSVAGGRPETDERLEYDIVRPPGAPRVPGRTLIVCDSFAYKWFRLFKPYFENVRYVTWYNEPAHIVKEIRRADRVIVEADEILLKAQAAGDGHAVSVARRLGATATDRSPTAAASPDS